MPSFHKRCAQKPIRGTRTSPQTGQVITSTGNLSFDAIVGGGLQLGSMCLIEEDKFVTYSKVLAKYFLAEGVASYQTVFLASLDDEPNEILSKLPVVVKTDDLPTQQSNDDFFDDYQTSATNSDGSENDINTTTKQQQQSNGLRIAWRYNDMPFVSPAQVNAKIGHHFNLMEYMPAIELKLAQIFTWPHIPLESDDEFAVSTDGDGEPNTDNHQRDFETLLHQSFTACNLTATTEAANNVANENKQASSVDNDSNNASDTNNIKDDNNTQIEANTNMANASNFSQLFCNETSISLGEKLTDLNVRTKCFYNPQYDSLLKELLNNLEGINKNSDEMRFPMTANANQKTVCRICITSLASPLWYEENLEHDLMKFLTILRAIVRSTSSVCFLTMPMHLIRKYDDSLCVKIRNLADYAIELESFIQMDGVTNNPYRNYNGLLHIHKITALNTLSAYKPETTDLGFKLRRKYFVIEKLHLPPELENEANNSNEMQANLSCSGGSEDATTSVSKSLLDF